MSATKYEGYEKQKKCEVLPVCGWAKILLAAGAGDSQTKKPLLPPPPPLQTAAGASSWGGLSL